MNPLRWIADRLLDAAFIMWDAWDTWSLQRERERDRA